VLPTTALQLLDPRAEALVAVVRAAGPSGSGRMELDLGVRDRHQTVGITPVERFGKPTS
jgi:hypothetical protein